MPSSLEEGIFYPRVSHLPCTQVGKTLLVLSHNQHHTHESRDLGKRSGQSSDMGWMDAGLYSKQFVHSE